MAEVIIRKYTEKDIAEMTDIWNEVVEDGIAFPQEDCLDAQTGAAFFAQQTYCGVAQEVQAGKILGCIFCIRIMLADAAILQMQAMQSLEIAEGCILVKSL